MPIADDDTSARAVFDQESVVARDRSSAPATFHAVPDEIDGMWVATPVCAPPAIAALEAFPMMKSE